MFNFENNLLKVLLILRTMHFIIKNFIIANERNPKFLEGVTSYASKPDDVREAHKKTFIEQNRNYKKI